MLLLFFLLYWFCLQYLGGEGVMIVCRARWSTLKVIVIQVQIFMERSNPCPITWSLRALEGTPWQLFALLLIIDQKSLRVTSLWQYVNTRITKWIHLKKKKKALSNVKVTRAYIDVGVSYTCRTEFSMSITQQDQRNFTKCISYSSVYWDFCLKENEL